MAGVPRSGTSLHPGAGTVSTGGRNPAALPVLFGLWTSSIVRPEFQAARELGEQLLRLGQNASDPALLTQAHWVLGFTLLFMGAFAPARAHLEHVMALYDPQQHRSYTLLYGQDPGATSLYYAALALWYLGYPDQALQRSQQAVTLAQELSHPFSLGVCPGGCGGDRSVPSGGATDPRAGRGPDDPLDRAEVCVLGGGGNGAAGLGTGRARAGSRGDSADTPGSGRLAGHGGKRCTSRVFVPSWPRSMGTWGRQRQGSRVLTEVLADVHNTGLCYCEAELYRLKGVLAAGCGGRVARRKPVFSRPSMWPATRRPNPGSCALPRAWHASGSSRASGPRPATAGANLRLVHRGV